MFVIQYPSQEHQGATFARCVSHNPSYSIQTRFLQTVEILQRCTLFTLHKASARDTDLRMLLQVQSDWSTSPSLISNINAIYRLPHQNHQPYFCKLTPRPQLTPCPICGEQITTVRPVGRNVEKKVSALLTRPAAVARLKSHVCLSAHRETRQ